MRCVCSLASLGLVFTLGCSTLDADAQPPFCGPAQCPPAARVRAPTLEVVEQGAALPAFAQGGRRYVMGESGARYVLRVTNPTAERLEAVVSVDGLDVVDGQPASLSKRGYIVPPYGEVTIDGWRTSLDAVAAFRFSSVGNSYAARTGQARNVGVIGVAFFRERRPPVVVAPPPMATAAPSAQATGGAARGAADDGAGTARSAPAPAARAQATQRPGLGTQFGESHDSQMTYTSFERATVSPFRVEEVRYDDRAGLVSRGIPVPPLDDNAPDSENARRDRATPFPESRFAQPPP